MSTLTLWSRRDPFAEFDAVVRRAFGPTVRPVTRTNGFVPAADLDRDGDDAVVRLELPGLDAGKDVTVELRVSADHINEAGRYLSDMQSSALREELVPSMKRVTDAVLACKTWWEEREELGR